jgi:hypothetical protein
VVTYDYDKLLFCYFSFSTVFVFWELKALDVIFNFDYYGSYKEGLYELLTIGTVGLVNLWELSLSILCMISANASLNSWLFAN